jgi:hypothetical protein
LAAWGRMGLHGAAWGRMGRMGINLQDPRAPGPWPEAEALRPPLGGPGLGIGFTDLRLETTDYRPPRTKH